MSRACPEQHVVVLSWLVVTLVLVSEDIPGVVQGFDDGVVEVLPDIFGVQEILPRDVRDVEHQRDPPSLRGNGP